MAEWILYDDLDGWIPDRPPIRMVDRLMIDSDAQSAVGIKAVSIGEPYFQGHFPGSPIMPGVLQVAAMIQAGSALVRACRPDTSDRPPVCVGLRRVKFRTPVLPGDRLRIEAALAETADQGEYVVKASVFKGSTRASQGEILLADEPQSTVAADTDAMIAAADAENPEDDAGDVLDVQQIMEVIPHRFPFLLVDRLVHMDAGAGRVVGMKNVSSAEPYFQGAAEAAVPPFLLPEMAAQTGCMLALCRPENKNKLAYFMSIDDAKFLAPVIPGDTLLIELSVEGRGRFGRAAANLRVGDRTVASTEIKYAVVDREA